MLAATGLRLIDHVQVGQILFGQHGETLVRYESCLCHVLKWRSLQGFDIFVGVLNRLTDVGHQLVLGFRMGCRRIEQFVDRVVRTRVDVGPLNDPLLHVGDRTRFLRINQPANHGRDVVVGLLPRKDA